MKKMNLGQDYNYGGLKFGDILETLRPLLSTGQYILNYETGKITPKGTRGADWDTPWYHVKHHPDFHCGLWHRIMFDYFKFIPSGCMGCWKVVVRPRHLLDLFKLLELQIEMDRPSKCGAELRPNVYGPWGGYFYNSSVEEGQKCYEEVCAKCEEYEINFQQGQHGKPVLPLLKRACTEYEMELGPSYKWRQTGEQKMLEKIIKNHVVIPRYAQPRLNKPHIVKTWIEQAYSLGDPTVWQFNDNEEFFRPYATYHREAKNAKV